MDNQNPTNNNNPVSSFGNTPPSAPPDPVPNPSTLGQGDSPNPQATPFDWPQPPQPNISSPDQSSLATPASQTPPQDPSWLQSAAPPPTSSDTTPINSLPSNPGFNPAPLDNNGAPTVSNQTSSPSPSDLNNPVPSISSMPPPITPPAEQPGLPTNPSAFGSPLGSAQTPQGPNPISEIPIQTPTPPAAESAPPWASIPTTTSSNGSNPIPSEPAPTDLSQLTGVSEQSSNPAAEVYVPPVSSPENLVVPTSASQNPEAISSNNHHASLMPKLLIVGGVLVLLLVAGASAYFILGIGKAPATNPETSLPAEQAPLTNPPTPIESPTTAPVATTSAEPTSTDSATPASFGSLNGDSASPSPTSALERLRQRQSPTP